MVPNMKIIRLLAVLAMSVLPFYFGCSEGKAKAAQSEASGRQVKVARAEQGQLAREVTVTGTLAAEEEVTVSAKVSGRVGEIYVDLGARVRRGQVLARLEPEEFDLRVSQAEAAAEQARVRLGLQPEVADPSAIQAEDTALVKEAEAVLEKARLTQDRMTSLYEQGLVPKSQLDDAVAGYRVADARYQDALEEVRNRQAQLRQRYAELEIARQQQEDSILVSSLNGAVQERLITRGQYLSDGAPAFRLVNSHPLRLRLAVPERDSGGIRVGQKVRVQLEGDSASYFGRVARMSPAISSDNRTLAVEAEIPNEQGLLRPGSFARAAIVIESADTAILVPKECLVSFAGVDKVIAVQENKAVEKRVRTGRRSGELVEIVEGLQAGEEVVISPGNLVNGDPVTPLR